MCSFSRTSIRLLIFNPQVRLREEYDFEICSDMPRRIWPSSVLMVPSLMTGRPRGAANSGLVMKAHAVNPIAIKRVNCGTVDCLE